MSKRKGLSSWWQAVIYALANVYLGNKLLVTVEVAITFTLIPLASYAWRKTRICPLQIMGRVPIVSWARAFRLMYKKQALRMMVLYFYAAGMVITKCIFVVLYGIVFLIVKLVRI